MVTTSPTASPFSLVTTFKTKKLDRSTQLPDTKIGTCHQPILSADTIGRSNRYRKIAQSDLSPTSADTFIFSFSRFFPFLFLRLRDFDVLKHLWNVTFTSCLFYVLWHLMLCNVVIMWRLALGTATYCTAKCFGTTRLSNGDDKWRLNCVKLR